MTTEADNGQEDEMKNHLTRVPDPPLPVPISPHTLTFLRECVDERLGNALRESVGDFLAYGRMADAEYTAQVRNLVRLALTDHLDTIVDEGLWERYGPEQDPAGPTWWEQKTADVGAALDEALRKVFEGEETPGPMFVVVRAVLQRYAAFVEEDTVGTPWWFRWFSFEEREVTR